MTEEGITVRQPAWYHYVGVLALVGVGYLVALATSTHTPRPANVRPPDRPPPPIKVNLPPPPPPAPPEEPRPVYTDQELAIIRGMVPEHEEGFRWREPGSVAAREYEQRVELRKRAFEKAGGDTPAALPLYLRLLTMNRPRDVGSDMAVMWWVAKIPGERSAFRQPAVDRLNDPNLHMAMAAMKLLAQIATPEDVPAVVERFIKIEYDDRIEPRDHAYFAEGLKILAKFGGEAETAALDQAKAEHLLANDDKFWAKAEACKMAIRERLAKQKVDKK